MTNEDHLCRIPCNSLPLVSEADFGLALKPAVHCDRIVDFHVLIYILKGGMEIIEDNITFQLHPGTLFLLKSGVHHWGERPFESGTAWYYIHFFSQEPTEKMFPLEDRLMFDERKSLPPQQFNCYVTLPKILQLPVGNELEKQIEKLICQYSSSDQTDLIRMNLSLWEILLHSFDLGQGKSEDTKENNRTKAVIAFLEQNFARNFTANELEDAMGFTYKYIGTLFKNRTGMSIKDYQRMLRIRKAVRLLCETELPIAEIANETGFYDAFYFSKIFKREEGISPLKFRDTYVPKI